MIKVIAPSSFGFDQPITSLVELHSRGVDSSWLRKSAAVLTKEMSDLRPEAGTTFVHLIALGDSESFGANRNGDCFPKSANEKYHDTFVKHAKWYHNHKNKPHLGHPDFGYVKASAYNPEMHRVELIIGIDEKKDPDSIQKLASGQDLPVSMSCVLDPEYPVLTKEGYKPISQVVPGDAVWTHAGRWRRVTGMNRRRYTGEACRIKVNGLPGDVPLTGDHPMFAAVFRPQIGASRSLNENYVKQKTTRYFRSKEEFDDNKPSWIHTNHLEKGDRFFYAPVTEYPGFGAIDDAELASLMGYYIAEGSLSYNKDRACTTTFTVNTNDAALRRIPAIISSLYPDVTCKITTHKLSGVCFNIQVFNTNLSEFFHRFVGAGCRRKKVCPELFNADKDVKLAFTGAWLDADGFVDKKGLHWSTVNQHLALQLRDLLASIGIPASIYRIDHSNSEGSGMVGSLVEYTINVSHVERSFFTRWSTKALNCDFDTPDVRKRPSSMRKCFDGLYSYRIKEVEKYFVEDAQTYNIEVEEDESYSLGGFISHNCTVPHDICTICKNKAKKADEYCQHIKEAVTQFTEDGRQIAMINEQPTFFDISKVYRNADRIAFTLRKAASTGSNIILSTDLADAYGITEPFNLVKDAKTLGRIALLSKLAEIEKEIDGQVEGDQNLKNIACATQEMPDSFGTVQDSDLKGVFGALSNARVSLPMEDFFKLVMGDKYDNVSDSIPSARSSLSSVFSDAANDPMDFLNGISNYEPLDKSLPTDIKRIIDSVARGGSLDSGPMGGRVQITILRKKAEDKLKAPVTKEGKQLAEEYARYKFSFIERVSDPFVVKMAVLQNFG